jgi:Flp pilus assembly protein TadB
MGCFGILLILAGLVVFVANWLIGLIVMALGVWMLVSGGRGKRIERQNREMIEELKALRRERDEGR